MNRATTTAPFFFFIKEQYFLACDKIYFNSTPYFIVSVSNENYEILNEKVLFIGHHSTHILK